MRVPFALRASAQIGGDVFQGLKSLATDVRPPGEEHNYGQRTQLQAVRATPGRARNSRAESSDCDCALMESTKTGECRWNYMDLEGCGCESRRVWQHA